MFTRNHRQEALSRAYVQAVAARAGVICSTPDLDYGVDLTLRAVDEVNGFVDAGVVIDLQLKATVNAVLSDSAIGYDLRVEDYERLRRVDFPVPQLLVAFRLPPKETKWATQTESSLVLRHAAFWVSLRGSPPAVSAKTTRVWLPRANLFTPDAVTALLARARLGEPL